MSMHSAWGIGSEAKGTACALKNVKLLKQ